ncbi:unnamed protein product [Rhizopus stolonifer]
MDLSWCIMCDCHCIEDSLYCSESCRAKDKNNDHTKINITLDSPPTSPLFEPFLSYFNHDRRTYTVVMNKPVNTYYVASSIPKYSL